MVSAGDALAFLLRLSAVRFDADRVASAADFLNTFAIDPGC